MQTDYLLAIANQTGLCVSLTADPSADEGERFVASVGLDAAGAGPTPGSAIRAALSDLAAGYAHGRNCETSAAWRLSQTIAEVVNPA